MAQFDLNICDYVEIEFQVWSLSIWSVCRMFVLSAECWVCQNRSLFKNRQTHITRLLTTHRSVFGLFHSSELLANIYGRLEKEQSILFSSDKQEQRKKSRKILVFDRFYSSVRVYLFVVVVLSFVVFYRRVLYLILFF